jgi:choline dehydrogenase-like flavoprotein
VNQSNYDVVIIGSGAGGGTVAYELRDLARAGLRVLVLEQGPRLRDDEFTGRELDMAPALYADGGGFLTADGTMTLAFGQLYGGSTVVYTGTSLIAPERVVRGWNVPGLEYDDLVAHSRRYAEQNNVHLLGSAEINDNNRLFVEGARAAGYHAEQFPLNVKGCTRFESLQPGLSKCGEAGDEPRAVARGRTGRSRSSHARGSASPGRARGACTRE